MRPGGEALFLVLIALAVLTFFRPSFFWYWDEWDNVERLAMMSFHRFVGMPDCEHFLPLQKLMWGLEVVLAGENYGVLVVANCILLAAAGTCLARLLLALDVAPLLAVPLAAYYTTTYANWEVASWGCMNGVALVTVCTIAAFRLQLGVPHPDREVVARASLLALGAAWSQGSGMPVAGLLAIFVVLDRLGLARQADRPTPLWPAAVYAGLFAATVGLYLWSGPTARTETTLTAALANTPSLLGRLGILGDWIAFALAMGFYGPLVFALGATHPPTHFHLGALAGLMLMATALTVLARTRWRGPAVKLALYQLAIFLASGTVRMRPNPLDGYAFRYQTYGMPGVLCFFAFGVEALLEHAGPTMRRAARATVALALVLATGTHLRTAHHHLSDQEVGRGAAVRAAYFHAKDWLARHAGGATPDGLFTPTAHPAFRFQQLASVIGIFDPNVRLPDTFEPATYILQTRNARPWGPIYGATTAVQTFTLDRPGKLFAIDLLLATYGRRRGPRAEVVVTDSDGYVLATERVPSARVFNNQWVPILTEPVPVAAGRPYRLELRAPNARPRNALTVWMATDPEAYPNGETITPDGAHGDFTFRLGYVLDAGA
jgi:hypothetical protein